jgi:hypothetical protein
MALFRWRRKRVASDLVEHYAQDVDESRPLGYQVLGLLEADQLRNGLWRWTAGRFVIGGAVEITGQAGLLRDAKAAAEAAYPIAVEAAVKLEAQS